MAGIINLEKGKQMITCGQPLTAVHLITKGKIQVDYPGGSYLLGKGDVVGIGEVCSEVHFLTYTTCEETSLLSYSLSTLDSLDNLLQKNTDVARLFLLSMFKQINTLQNRCSISELNCNNLYHSLTEDYEKYKTLCGRYRLTPRALDNLDDLGDYVVDETPDLWLNGYYMGLANIYASGSSKILLQDSSVSLGMLHKGSLDFRKTYLSLEEQYSYLQQISVFYFDESGNDIFDFYTSLYYKLGQDSEDAEGVLSDIHRILQQIKEKLALDPQKLESRIHSFEQNMALISSSSVTEDEEVADSSVTGELVGSLNTILDFVGEAFEDASSFRQHVNSYKALEDRSALDDESTRLRKELTAEFNKLYAVSFERTLSSPVIPMPVRMLLYFGYVDEELAGTNNAAILYRLANSMSDHSASGVYTLYDWLLAIYNGKKEPSRNEFEQDYSDYVHKQKASGNYSDIEIREMEKDGMRKIRYELENMFPQVNKITFGRIATFCPLFSSDNVLKSLNDSYVTVDNVCKAIEQIKQVDYSAFYRESLDMDHLDTMGKENIHLEFLPDVILMPNVGIRGVMWQEIEGKRRNSPGRMTFSIFHMEDLRTSFIRMTGEFRWELCKRVQGNRWNDVSERSLTSEYFDYVQFYRKNHDLTPEAKERVRASLQRAKNSFKEMFVRDYLVWVLYEGNGSPRLNKVARQILFVHCPFPADICETLEQNPLYTELLNRHKVVTAQRVHHLNKLLQKLRNGRTPVPETLEQEIAFAQGKPII